MQLVITLTQTMSEIDLSPPRCEAGPQLLLNQIADPRWRDSMRIFFLDLGSSSTSPRCFATRSTNPAGQDRYIASASAAARNFVAAVTSHGMAGRLSIG
jgi:hypothetical protein